MTMLESSLISTYLPTLLVLSVDSDIHKLGKMYEMAYQNLGPQLIYTVRLGSHAEDDSRRSKPLTFDVTGKP
jgi:hypothetical protein